MHNTFALVSRHERAHEICLINELRRWMRRLHTTTPGVRGDRMAVLLINDLQISLSPASWVAMRFIIIITLDNVTLRSPRWQLKSICILCFPISMRQFHLNVSSESRNYRYIVWWRMKISLRSEFRRRKEKNKFWVAYLIRPHSDPIWRSLSFQQSQNALWRCHHPNVQMARSHSKTMYQ